MHQIISLSGKTILVTGASSGIGKEAAVLSSKLEAKVVITGRSEERLNETYTQLEGGAHYKFTADLSKEENISRFCDGLPMLDGIVHSAGIVKPFPVKYIQKKHINEVLDINYTAPVLLTSYLLKAKKINQGASLVFISSVSSTHPYLGGALYVSSKAAIEAYCKTVALELAPVKIRANIISPGLVKTAILANTEAASGKEEIERHEKFYPLGFGEPVDVANMITFLLSDAAKWITGTNIIMDGGLLLSKK
jgi:NAD(P)-dependent dehydrogenase (short-subunit alcohol dehydrogenase family)